MKLTLALLSLFYCGCIASTDLPIKDNKQQKRSINDGLFGLSLSSIGDTSISSHTHTHTHSTAVVERPVAVPVPISSPTITTTKIISPAIQSTYIPSTYSSFSSSYPYLGAYPYGKYYSGFGKYYSGFYPSISYPSTKSFYTSSPVWKYNKW